MVSPIADTFGEAMLGLVFASVFYGITVMQTYTYYDQAKNDGAFVKLLVAAIFALDTAHLGLVVHVLWFYLIDSFGQPKNLHLVVWSLLVQIIVSTTIATIVQCFFAWRVRMLSRTWLISVPIVIFAFLHLAFDLYFVVSLWRIGNFSGIPGLTWATSTSLANSVASDVLVAAAMCFFLFTSKSGVKRSDSVVNNLIMYAVTTGSLTTVFSLATLILFAVSPTFLSQMFYFSIAKFYTNSLLASLNAREKMRHMFAGGTANSIHLSDMRVPPNTMRSGGSGGGPKPNIQVSVAHHVTHDGSYDDMRGVKSGEAYEFA